MKPLAHSLVIDRLLKLAAMAHRLCDNADEGRKTVTVCMDDYRALCVELDALDRLPEVPNEAADGWRKAEYILRPLLNRDAAWVTQEDAP